MESSRTGSAAVDVEGSTTEITADKFAVMNTFENWNFDTTWGMSTNFGRLVLKAIPESGYGVYTDENMQTDEPDNKNIDFAALDTLEGEGTKDNPYLISTLSDLETLSNNVNAGYGADKYFMLTADIDMSEKYNTAEEISWTRNKKSLYKRK